MHLHVLRCYCRALPSSFPAVKMHSALPAARLAIHTLLFAARNQTLIGIPGTNSFGLMQASGSRNSSWIEQLGKLAAEGVRFRSPRKREVEMGCTKVLTFTRQEPLARVLSSSVLDFASRNVDVHYDHEVNVQTTGLKTQLLCLSNRLQVTLQLLYFILINNKN